MASELSDCYFEGRERPQRGFVEEHRDVTAVENLGGRRMPAERPVGLHLRGELQAVLELGGVEVEDRQKVFSRLGRWGHRVCCLCNLCVLRARAPTFARPR